MKQLALGVTQYVQDYDETFPVGVSKTDWQNLQWTQTVQPYIKSIGVFGCPSDAKSFEVNQQWMGVGISYAGNAWYDEWCCSPVWSSGFKNKGVFNFWGEGWLMHDPKPIADVSRPADTIMIAEKHNADSKYAPSWMGFIGNQANFSPNVLFGGSAWPNDFGDPKIPDGTRTEAPYPEGKAGAVSTHRNGMTNFAFVDGHVKAMKPEQTNPGNDAAKNLWDSTRR